MKKGWERIPIEAFAKTGAGGTPIKSNKTFYEGGDIPWLMSGEVANANICEAKNYITKAGLAGSSAKLFPPDSVLVAMYGATAGEVGILRFEAATNQAVCAILPSQRHIPEFLYYYLLFAKQQLVSQAIGNAQPNISQEKIRRLEIPIPPLPEQKRIVEVLDKAFEGLAVAKANAEANLQNARELFGLLRDDLLINYSNDWQEMKLNDLLEQITYGFTNPMPDADDGPYKVTAKNVVDGAIDYTNARKTTFAAFKNLLTDKSRPKVGDVLLTKDGTLGRTAVVDRSDICVNQSVAVLTPTKSVKSAFLMHLLNCKKHQDKMLADAGGTTIKHLYITRVPKIHVKVPTLVRQVELLGQLEMLKFETTRVVEAFSKKTSGLDALKQSILQKAFAGELI